MNYNDSQDFCIFLNFIYLYYYSFILFFIFSSEWDQSEPEWESSDCEWEPSEPESNNSESDLESRGRKPWKVTGKRKCSPSPDKERKMLSTHMEYDHVSDSDTDVSTCSEEYPALVESVSSHSKLKIQVATKKIGNPKKHCCKFCQRSVNKISACSKCS